MQIGSQKESLTKLAGSLNKQQIAEVKNPQPVLIATNRINI
jgi:hypothetical protein